MKSKNLMFFDFLFYNILFNYGELYQYIWVKYEHFCHVIVISSPKHELCYQHHMNFDEK